MKRVCAQSCMLAALLLIACPRGVSALTTTFLPVDDTYVCDDQADVNFSDQDKLYTKTPGGSGPTYISYLKFNVHVSGTINSAQLRLYNDNNPTQINVCKVLDNSWVASAVTWNARPTPGALLATKTGNELEYWDIDVSSWVNANEVYSFALTDGAVRCRFGSSRSVNPPQLTVDFTPPAPATTTNPANQDFQGGAGQTPYTLSTFGDAPGPAVQGGALLAASGSNQQNVIAFNQTTSGLVRHVTAEWDFSVNPSADGLGFALLNTSTYGTSGAGPELDYWDKPNMPGTFGIGIDTFYWHMSRSTRFASHEVSLHWDGAFRENNLSPVDFTTPGTYHAKAEVNYLSDGANVSVWIAGAPVYEDYYVAGMTPYDCRPALGAQTSATSGTVTLDNVHVSFDRPMEYPAPPLTVHTFNKEPVTRTNRKPQRAFAFPSDGKTYSHIILRLSLDPPAGGYDHWDRKASVYVWNDAGDRIEIARYVTPYGRLFPSWMWWIDVTDYQSILRGSRQVGLFIDTWVPQGDPSPDGYGWLVTTDFDFYEGRPDYIATSVENLWVGDPEYGNPAVPISAFFTPKNVTIPAGAQRTKLRFMVTGHGWDNADNACEFLDKGRTVRANGAATYNELWTPDNFLTPAQPQTGTWIFSRAGWGPGAVCAPWDLDVTSHVAAGQPATIEYEPDPFTRTDFTGDKATYWVESQIINYQRPPGASATTWTRY